MSNPSTGNRGATAKDIEANSSSILTLLAPTTQDLQARSQHLSSQRRSPQPEAHQLDRVWSKVVGVYAS